jgi:ArsR family transcriptional regulator, virulence genes transcriptional regulator
MNVIEMLPHAERATELLRTLAHPYRLLVLCALREGEKSVSRLQAELEAAQVPLSQQLMRLRADGLVDTRKDGNQVIYRIAKPEVVEILVALHHVLCVHAATTATSNLELAQ